MESMGVERICYVSGPAMYRSDNTAPKLLMSHLGGPVHLTGLLRSIGDRTTRIDSDEGQIEKRPALFDLKTPRSIPTSA